MICPAICLKQRRCRWAAAIVASLRSNGQSSCSQSASHSKMGHARGQVVLRFRFDFDQFCIAILIICLDIFYSTFLCLIDSVCIVFLRSIYGIGIWLGVIISSALSIFVSRRATDRMSSIVVGYFTTVLARYAAGHQHNSYGEYRGSCPVGQVRPARPAPIDQFVHRHTAEVGHSQRIELVVSPPLGICLNDGVLSLPLSSNQIRIASSAVVCSSPFDDQTQIQTPYACGPFWSACDRRNRTRSTSW